MPIEVYGPETHMTAIVSMALGLASGDPEVCACCKAVFWPNMEVFDFGFMLLWKRIYIST